MGKKDKNPKVKVEEVIKPEVEEKATEILTKVDEVIEEKDVDVEAPAVIDGDDGMTLNIRRKPEIAPNNQIAILGKGTKIIVVNPDEVMTDKDGNQWYKVRTKVDADKDDPIYNGYAMKKYIKLI